MMSRGGSILLIAICLAAPSALANGVISERAAGGLVFKKTDTIAIASEDLFLSTDEVRVAYVYTSTAPAAQTVTISFPMPGIPLDNGPEAEVFTQDGVKDPRNYMNFSVQVDGRPVQARRAERALFKDKDVGARLKAAGVPALFVIGGDEALKRVSEATKAELVKEGLFVKSDSDEYTPQWSYQTIFEWEQTFRPGPTKVDIRYKPIVGNSADYGDYYEKGEGVKRYCADETFRNAMKRRRAGRNLGRTAHHRLRAQDRALLERPDRPVPPGRGQGPGEQHRRLLSARREKDFRDSIRVDRYQLRPGARHRRGRVRGPVTVSLGAAQATSRCLPRANDQLGQRNRPAEQVALGVAAPGRAQQRELLHRFDALRDRAHAEAAAERDHAADDRGAIGAVVHFRHERAVDLDLVERKHLEIAERGIPGPEIVEHDRDAKLLELVKHRQVLGVLLQQHGFCDLELQPLGRNAGLAQRARDGLDQVAGAELRRRKVDGDAEMRRPAGRVAAGLCRIHAPSGTMRPVSSARGMNWSGLTMPSCG